MTDDGKAALHAAITNSLEYKQRLFAAGGTILPCISVRRPWWRRILRFWF